MPRLKSKIPVVCLTGPLAPYAAELTRGLTERGYTPSTRTGHLRVMAHLSKWLQARQLSVLDLNGYGPIGSGYGKIQQVTTLPWNRLGVLTEQNLRELQVLFTTTWWAADRTEEEVRRAVHGADLVYGLTDPESGRLVAFARVLTDFTSTALVLDVIVDPGLRGHGAGAALMDTVTRDPKLAGVRTMELVCRPELFAFYRRWGFTTEVGGSKLMRRTDEPLLSSRL